MINALSALPQGVRQTRRRKRTTLATNVLVDATEVATIQHASVEFLDSFVNDWTALTFGHKLPLLQGFVD